MHRNVTAIYRTYATADLVRRELKDLGVSSGDIHVVPDTDDAAGPTSSTNSRDDSRYSDQLHDLHLPDDDLKMYQQCVRRGDYIVSAEVDENQVSRAQEIMRRPEDEAYNMELAKDEFGNAAVAPHSTPDSRRTNEEWRAERDPAHEDPYTRSYRRNARLDTRRD